MDAQSPPNCHQRSVMWTTLGSQLISALLLAFLVRGCSSEPSQTCKFDSSIMNFEKASNGSMA